MHKQKKSQEKAHTTNFSDILSDSLSIKEDDFKKPQNLNQSDQFKYKAYCLLYNFIK
jgi:hypothetical protein